MLSSTNSRHILIHRFKNNPNTINQIHYFLSTPEHFIPNSALVHTIEELSAHKKQKITPSLKSNDINYHKLYISYSLSIATDSHHHHPISLGVLIVQLGRVRHYNHPSSLSNRKWVIVFSYVKVHCIAYIITACTIDMGGCQMYHLRIDKQKSYQRRLS